MALYDRLLHAWGSKPQLRIAVTGTTSSGKSYLLRDLITALERHSTIGDGKRSNPLFNTILQLRNQLMHIEKTAMFPMRQDGRGAPCRYSRRVFHKRQPDDVQQHL